MNLAKMIYEITKTFPREEIYGLTSQLRRAGVSVPSNIAEWSSRSSDKHFIQYIQNAQGSIFEIETQLTLAQNFWYIKQDTLDQMLTVSNEIWKMSTWLIKSLNN